MADVTDGPTDLPIPVTGQTVAERIDAEVDVLGIPFRGQMVGSIHASGDPFVTYQPCGCCGQECVQERTTPCTRSENGYYAPYTLYFWRLTHVPALTDTSGGFVEIDTPFTSWLVNLSDFGPFAGYNGTGGECEWSAYVTVETGGIEYLWSPDPFYSGSPYGCIATLYYDSGWKIRVELIFYGVLSGIIVILALSTIVFNNTRYLVTVTLDTQPAAPNSALLVYPDPITFELIETDTLYTTVDINCPIGNHLVTVACCAEPIPEVLLGQFISATFFCEVSEEAIIPYFYPVWDGASKWTFPTLCAYYGDLQCVDGEFQLSLYKTSDDTLYYQEVATVVNCYPLFLRFPSTTLHGCCDPDEPLDAYFEIFP